MEQSLIIKSLSLELALGSGRGLVIMVSFLGLKGRGFNTHTGHGSLFKLRQFHLPQFALVYSAANEYMYQHCWEGTCDGLASCNWFDKENVNVITSNI